MKDTPTVLADLVERCTKAEASLHALAAEQPTTHAGYRLEGKMQGVALVRGYIEEVMRDAARIAARATS